MVSTNRFYSQAFADTAKASHLEGEHRQDEGVPGVVRDRVAGPQHGLAQEARQEQPTTAGPRQLPAAAVRLPPIRLCLRGPTGELS
jgi:hypothetical protein